MTHQLHLARAAVWQSEYERKRRKVAAWHTLWELGQAREALRRMGEVLPVPPRRSREAFADAIYRLADQSDEPFERHLTVLDGGLGDTTPSARGGAAARRDPGQVSRMGSQPPVASGDVERQGHPHPDHPLLPGSYEDSVIRIEEDS